MLELPVGVPVTRDSDLLALQRRKVPISIAVCDRLRSISVRIKVGFAKYAVGARIGPGRRHTRTLILSVLYSGELSSLYHHI